MCCALPSSQPRLFLPPIFFSFLILIEMGVEKLQQMQPLSLPPHSPSHLFHTFYKFCLSFFLSLFEILQKVQPLSLPLTAPPISSALSTSVAFLTFRLPRGSSCCVRLRSALLRQGSVHLARPPARKVLAVQGARLSWVLGCGIGGLYSRPLLQVPASVKLRWSRPAFQDPSFQTTHDRATTVPKDPDGLLQSYD